MFRKSVKFINFTFRNIREINIKIILYVTNSTIQTIPFA